MPASVAERGALFFNPPYPWLGKKPGPSDITSQIPIVPLGPGSVFAYFVQHADAPGSFYYAPDHSVSAVRRVISERYPAVVAISCNSYNRFACLAIGHIAKTVDPSIKVVLGGVHPTFLDEQILAHYPFVDCIVRGEGEVTFCELFRSLQQRKDLGHIDGVSFRDGNRIVRTKPRLREKTLDEFPLLDYDYFTSQGMKNKVRISYGAHTFPVETSRGCPFSCAFCATVGMWGRKVAFRSVERVIDQIRRVPVKAHMLLFHDMNLTLNKAYLKALCQALKSHNITVPWHCSTRLDLVDEDTLRMMKGAGCDGIFFGIESLSERILAKANKRYTPRQAIHSANLSASIGLKTRMSFIMGLPGETEETLRESLSNCIKLRKGIKAHVNPLMIIPGAEIYAQALREGFDESFWLRKQKSLIPLYEGAMPLMALKKWKKIFDSFRLSDEYAREGAWV